ncbi:MAG: NHL repeat-containing protein [Armatimonadota bacterium]|nr:NHL repeat-containing protein [Armatimonadota bacterium]MDR7588778.1 NHL repeat-containing protein [Armatimonadota bacterium]
MHAPLLLAILAAVGSGQLAPRVQFIITGFGPGQPFREPQALTIEGRSGTIYVADTGNDRVLAFSPQGLPLLQVATPRPLGVAATPDRIFVSDGARVKVFSRTGSAEDTLNLLQAGPEGTVTPHRLAADEDGHVYVADARGGQVLKFDSQGMLQIRFGRLGDGPGAFRMIAGLAVDRLGRIYVADSLGIPVQVFDRAGRYLTGLGVRSAGPEGFAFPTGVAVDRMDRIWIADQQLHQVKGVDLAGRFLGAVGAYGLREGQLFFPTDVATDGFGRLHVLEKGANRLQVFQLDRP